MSNLSELLPTGGGQNAVDFVASGTLGSGQTVILKADGTVEAVSGVSASQAVGTSQTTTANPRVMSSAYDSAQEKTVIVYADSNNSSYGTAVVVTTTGSTVSLGTPQVFESFNIGGGSRPTATVYDENSGKIVICYIQVNSGIGVYNAKAIVGTVSGTSISFGSSVNVSTSNNIHYLSAAYDSINNKVVVCYRDENNGNRGESKVGTVSGNSISFGGVTVFSSTTTRNMSMAFDANTGKIVIGYRASNNYGTSIVGTVGGTSIGFGSPVVFNSGTTSTIATSYDSTNNKVVIAYQKADGTSYGAAKVGTVSGTSISFGTEAVFSTTALYSLTGNSFDINSGKVIIAYGTTTAYTEKAICGLVSGTGISFTDAVIDLPNSGGNGVTVTYDASALISVVGLQATSTNLGVATIQPAYSSTNVADFIGITAEAISDTATGAVNVYGGINEAQTGLTIGSDYYVQDDGSLSTATSTVKAGQAISATTINMMDLT